MRRSLLSFSTHTFSKLFSFPRYMFIFTCIKDFSNFIYYWFFRGKNGPNFFCFVVFIYLTSIDLNILLWAFRLVTRKITRNLNIYLIGKRTMYICLFFYTKHLSLTFQRSSKNHSFSQQNMFNLLVIFIISHLMKRNCS